MEKQTKVITNTNQKGGVGKTTTSAAMLSGLQKRGFKVLGIDLDPQCNLSYLVKANPKLPSIKDVVTEELDITDVIQSTESGYDFIQSSRSIEKAMNDLDALEQVYKLQTELEKIKGIYDYIIIDTPPALSALTINALVASDDVIIPVQADSFSMQGAASLSKTVSGIKRVNQKLNIAGILIVRYKSRANIAQKMEEQFSKFSETLKTTVFKTKIRDAVAIQESQYVRENIFDYDNSKVAQDYDAFIKEYLGE